MSRNQSQEERKHVTNPSQLIRYGACMVLKMVVSSAYAMTPIVSCLYGFLLNLLTLHVRHMYLCVLHPVV